MKVRNDYNNCVTNLVSSFARYFDAEYYHDTLKDIDQILEEKKPKNVVLILLDGMGSRILENTLSEDSFFRKHMLKEIYTVFPATTTAATTSIQVGLNPAEHSWLGWNTYVKPIDKTVTLFLETEKTTGAPCQEFKDMLPEFSPAKLTDRINNADKYNGYEVSPYSTNPEGVSPTVDSMFENIEKLTQGKKGAYIYAYNNDPDATMHKTGVYSEETLNSILYRQDKVEQLCKNLKDTMVFVIADHGHIDCENIYLADYPEINEMLERPTSIEPRACSLKVKEQYKGIFREKFEQQLGQYFKLYDAKDVIDSKLFGPGKQHEYFEAAIGDFLAIGEDCPYCLIGNGDYDKMVTQHAGYTDAEIMVPVIMIDCM